MATSEASAPPPTTSVIWYKEKPVWVMLFLGFSAGVPLYLVFGSLSLWLREAGVERATVTYFSWAVLGYSFKWVWAPLVDRLPLPYLTSWLGRRRGWLLLSQLCVVGAIILMASTDPAQSLTYIAVGAVALGFSSATQDVVIDAYRIEAAVPRMQALLSSTYVAGYRIGMMAAGAWALLLAENFGSTYGDYLYEAWQKTYLIMALVMMVGVMTTLVIAEPSDKRNDSLNYSVQDHVRFFMVFLVSVATLVLVYSLFGHVVALLKTSESAVTGFFAAMLRLAVSVGCAVAVARLFVVNAWVHKRLLFDSYVAPFKDFLDRYGKLALWVLLLIGFYRVSDIVLGVITNVFYQDMGYSKSQIASITKVFGIVITITGAFLGGILAVRLGVMRALAIGAVLVAATNLLFVWLANVGQAHSVVSFSLPFISGSSYSVPLELLIVIAIDNLAQGFAIAAFIGWLSSLTNIAFSATQYAIFGSMMTLFPKLLGGYSGSLVDAIGYSHFFLLASLLGVPVVALVWFIAKHLKID